MIRCNHCGRLFDEEELVLVKDDPSAAGVCLPSGSYTYVYCPHCGSDEVDEFSLADTLDLEEGEDASEAIIRFGNKAVMVYIAEDGELQLGWFRYADRPKKDKTGFRKAVTAV